MRQFLTRIIPPAWVVLSSLAFPSQAVAGDNLILAGVLDLPRATETAPIDGCRKLQKGLTIGGGFLFFSCEKLRPEFNISHQQRIADHYKKSVLARGWKRSFDWGSDNPEQFIKTDIYGCETALKIMVWDDRVINETVTDRTDRNAFRQIVFLTSFEGKACEPKYQYIKSVIAAQTRASINRRLKKT